jgi:hypothetical protein
MKAHECYHCKQWVEEDEPHDCWTTTEAALTKDLSEDLQDAYERFRDAAVDIGEQRIYASHSSIMFARKACHFFVRPKRQFLEVVIFLGRPVKAPQIKKVVESSKTKRAHIIHIRHRDEVEAPLTDWMEEAYRLQDQPKAPKAAVSKPKRSAKPATKRVPTHAKPKVKAAKKKAKAKRKR